MGSRSFNMYFTQHHMRILASPGSEARGEAWA